MKAKMTYDGKGSPSHPDYPNATIPFGYVRDAPDAYKLVRAGIAVPADEECRQACRMTQAEIDLAQRNYPAMALGIWPDDREAFFAGKIAGYNADGSYIPGPNWAMDEEDEEDDEYAYDDLKLVAEEDLTDE